MATTRKARVTRLEASSIGGVLDAVRHLRQSWNRERGEEELWFRGADRGYPLLPALYRPSELASRYDEGTLFEAFRALGAPRAPHAIADEWDWYFLARHHGLPTRLLDWSTNVMVALFFALEPHVKGKTRGELDALALADVSCAVYGEACPILWVLEARTLNAWAHGTRGLIAVNDALDPMLPRLLGEGRKPRGTWSNKWPLAIVPRHTSDRIVAQGGRFTLHGRKQESLDQIAERTNVLVARIELSSAHVARMWDDLQTAGINGSTILKDLDSLVVYLKHAFDHTKGA